MPGQHNATPLRRKLFVQFLTLSLLPLLTVLAISAGVTTMTLIDSVEGHTAGLAQAVKDQLESRLLARQRTLELLAATVQADPPPHAQTQELMRAMIQLDRFIESIYITDSSGTIKQLALGSSVPLGENSLYGLDLSSRPIYQAARTRQATTWSGTFLSSLSGRVAVALARQVGQRTVMAELSLDALSKAVMDLSQSQGSVIMVLDDRGRIIVHPDAALVARQENFSHIPLVKQGMAGQDAKGAITIDGQRYLASVASVRLNGWSVLATQPSDLVYAPLFKLGWALLIGFALSLVASMVAASILAEQTARRYKRLLKAAEQQAQSQSTDVITFDVIEFQQLWDKLRLLFEQVKQRDAETRTARRQLQAVLDAATEVAIIATDEQGCITVFNKGAEKMLGYAAHQVIGTTPVIFHDEQEIQSRAALLSSQLNHPVSGFETFVVVARRAGYEVRDWTYIRRNGSKIRVSLAVTAVRDERGLINGFLGIASDQTERLRAADLDLARQAAEAANQAKSEFLSRVSHELRTPLNAMLGYTQLLALDPALGLKQRQRDQLDLVQKAGWHLVQLIEDVLDLSRIESGHVKVELMPVALRPLIDNAVQMVSPTISDPTLHITVLPAQGVTHNQDLRVWGDRTRLTQALVNLLSNAVKYNRPGGQVELSITEDSPHTLVIHVRDTGIGMSPHQLARLFEPFNRLGQQDGKIPGNGIGLVITKRLIELMDGTLNVSSTPHQGSCFTIRLKSADASTAPAQATSTVDTAAPATPSSGPHARLSVLYIEDNAINIQLMRAVLAMRPHCELHTVQTASEGAAAALRLQPALILLDLHLPDGSGLALLHHLREIHGLQQTHIVIVSADATQAQVDGALAAGAMAYLTKPISVPQVLQVIDQLLAPKSAGDAINAPQ